ncbi:MAG: hypothetical protein Q8934_21840 [Bacillota bacterium]|nr:hypothetical protein [Bacillota bacterium]
MIVLIIIGYSLLALFELIPFYHQKHWREFWVNAGFGFCSFTIAVLLSFDVNIPSPSEPIKNMVMFVIRKLV